MEQLATMDPSERVRIPKFKGIGGLNPVSEDPLLILNLGYVFHKATG